MSDKICRGGLGEKLDVYFSRIAPFGFSGGVLVAIQGEIILQSGYGSAVHQNRIPNTVDTIFSLGSITKQFTAAAILHLETRGLLHTSDELSRFFSGLSADKTVITIHHLLTHTAGLPEYSGGDYVMAPRDETMDYIFAQPTAFPPGERYAYSNTGYSVLAAIIELVSGESYEEYLTRHLLHPAGLFQTGYRLPDWSRSLVAHWYAEGVDNGTPLEKPYPSWNLMGNGDMLTTLEDLYKWHQALQGDKILSAEAKTRLYTPALEGYAYGWKVEETNCGKLIQHGGSSSFGSSAIFKRYIDTDTVIIIFANQSHGDLPLARVIDGKVEAILGGVELILPPPVQQQEIPQHITGHYPVAKESEFVITSSFDSYSLAARGQEAINQLLFPTEDFATYGKELNQCVLRIFESGLRGDYQPLADIIIRKEVRLPRFINWIESTVLPRKIHTVQVIGTVPSTLIPGALDTFVELKGEESFVSVAIWKDGQNVGFVYEMESTAIAKLPIQPVSPTDWVGYHIGTSQRIDLTITLSDGENPGLQLKTPGWLKEYKRISADK